MSKQGHQFFHQRHPGHNPTPDTTSSGKTFQLPIEVRGANDPKVVSTGKLIFLKILVIIGIMGVFSFPAAILFVMGWEDRPGRRDYGALNTALVIEVVGAISTIWVVTRKTSPVLTITKDGLLRHRRRNGLFWSGTPVPEVFVKWNDIAGLEARQEIQTNLIMGLPTGKHVAPLKYIWIFLHNAQSPVICDVDNLTPKSAEIFEILNSCFKTFGAIPSAASPSEVVKASFGKPIPKGPIEIRFGKRSAIVHLVGAIISGFLGGGLVWIGMFSAHGLWTDFLNADFENFMEVIFGLLMSWLCIYRLCYGCRSLVNRWPQLIIGEDALTYRRLALSMPWREINPDQLRFSFSQRGRFKDVLFNEATVCVTFHGSKDQRTFARSPVVLDVSKMDHTPEDIYYLIKARALSAKSRL